jgi:hypothetical protein
MGYDCGPVADGCGGLVNCGTCTAPAFCGAKGKPNVCGTSGTACVPKTCADLGANCGPVADGCGGLTADCGTCTAPDTCGGGGKASVCGHPPACVAKTCTDFPGTCGPQADGCGGVTASCGSCTAPQSCGGGGTAGVCGAPPACVKKTCADYPGTCGQLSDGCGGLTVSCGSCTAPQTCGGGGTPSVCGGTAGCVAKTCSTYPAGTCGQVSDGCGGLTTSCGTCTSPAICGGSGVPSQCGSGGTSCVNLACQQTTCTTGTTSISGTIYDPAGLRPLPNVNVYVPNGTVGALTTGATCDGCSAGLSGFPLVQTTTDIYGKFTLNNMPVGTNIPLVIQVGKWRRKVTIPTVAKCVNTPVAAGLTRLPKTKAEGDIPLIALTTGGADPLECLLRKIGIADSEFTNPTGTGRVHLYSGVGGTAKYATTLNAGATFPAATTLWSTSAALKKYDITLLGCEGSEYSLTDTGSNKTVAALEAMQDYANAGGRVFGSHYHYTWMRRSTAANGFPASYQTWASMVSWNTTLVTLTENEAILRTFSKATTMSDWMHVTPTIAAPWATGAIPYSFTETGGRRSINSINNTNILLWIQTTTNHYPQYFSFDTPVGAPKDSACGRFVFSDIHVSSGDTTGATNGFPTGCTTTTMSAQEGALEFMFFDLASPVCGGTTPPPTCTPQTCTTLGYACGSAPDGCGGVITSCGSCPTGQICSGGKCTGSGCTAKTCTDLGYSCGTWPDGCGGNVTCGACTAPATCGGGGTPGKCGSGGCVATTCAALGYDCGSWPDGCGNTLNCGPCTSPATCGGSGAPGKCGSTACTPATCTSLGYDCGSWPNGCGGVLTCGTCTAPAVCGSGGPGKCGASACVPRTCSELGVSCGPSGDGCGGTIDCGTCTGGGGCVPLACGGRCGPQGDGCGGILTCAACPGACVPTTCVAAGAECGQFPDGCGGLLECGTCTAPKSCGGGGVPNKCGGVS